MDAICGCSIRILLHMIHNHIPLLSSTPLLHTCGTCVCVLSCAAPRYAVPCYAKACPAMLCHAVLHHILPCHAVLRCAMLCYAMQLGDFLAPKVDKAGGMMAMADVYCLFNRARGTELVSPDDVLQACTCFPQAGVPLSIKQFSTGALVVQSRSHSTEQVCLCVCACMCI